MKKILLVFFTVIAANSFSQKVDSIYFHLYTDSLKKGVHNYINVDGKLSNGKWIPLTSKEVSFTASYGEFKGNDLVLPIDCRVEKITVKAVLRANPQIKKEITIWIKKKPDDEKLPTKEEIMNRTGRKNKNRN